MKNLKIGDEIGGHFVYGHDLVTEVIKIIKLDNSWEYHFNKNFNANNFVTEKASISINGISLTIASVNNKSFTISVIDHTYNNTNLKFINLNDKVNIEFDYLARFVLKMNLNIKNNLSPIHEIIEDARNGKMYILVDDPIEK